MTYRYYNGNIDINLVISKSIYISIFVEIYSIEHEFADIAHHDSQPKQGQLQKDELPSGDGVEMS